MEDSFGDKDFEEMKHEKKYKLVKVLLYRDVISFFLRKLGLKSGIFIRSRKSLRYLVAKRREKQNLRVLTKRV